MAASKRFRIPTLDEMENVSTGEAPQPLFKRRKEFNQENSYASTSIENSKTDRNITKPAAESKPTTKNASVKSTVPVNSNHSSHASTSSTRLDLHPQQNPKDGHIHKETDVSNGSSGNKLASNMHDSAETGSNSEISNGADDTSKGPSTASKPGSSNSLIVNTRQRGNPILKSVRNIPWEYGNIVPDYVMGQSNCALFLSLRYHQLHPNYIHERLKLLGKSYDLRVMLVQVDVKEPHHLLKDLAKICLLADCTLVLAFSPEEAGRYLETYKIFENKPPEAIMEKTEENFMAKFTDCLTRVKSVNKTDCATLISHFGSLANIMEASEEDLSLCPGFGPQKAKRLHDIFHEPFLRSATKGSSSKVNEISSS